MRYFALLGLLALVAIPTPRADACSCTTPTPCEAFQTAQVVFVGKVTDVQEANTEQTVTIAVSEKLKGEVDATVTVDGGGMCGANFTKGKTYIVYASGGKLRAGLCSRTQTTDRAKDDLAYARGFSKRVNGIVEGDIHIDDTDRTKRAGVEVRVRESKVRARTDKNGHYKLELPPGDYTLDVVDPKAKTPSDTADTVDIVDKQTCVRRDLVVVWNGRVRGHVTGVDGKPAVGIQITLVGERGNSFATTDAKGNYEVSGVQAGDYTVVAFSTRGVPTSTFYPGVDEPSKAKTIKLSQAQAVQKIDFKLLP